MPNKGRNWTDVELIISSVSIAFTLGFWGLFASRQKTGADVLGQVSLVSSSGGPLPVSATQPAPATLVPGQVLFFGAATPQPQNPLASQTQTRRRGGGGGGGSGAPAPHTGSS